MQLCYLAFFEAPAPSPAAISQTDVKRIETCLAAIDGLSKAHLYTPVRRDGLPGDEVGQPIFGMQLFFNTIETLEDAVGLSSGLCDLATSGELTSLADAKATQQAMLHRSIPVTGAETPGQCACSYVAHYPGPAQDTSTWLEFYLRNHAVLMARFPKVQEVEVLTRIDWIDAMPWQRVDYMQRNRIMFDTADALLEAHRDSLREEMRRDFARFPAFDGGTFHYPMHTTIICH